MSRDAISMPSRRYGTIIKRWLKACFYASMAMWGMLAQASADATAAEPLSCSRVVMRITPPVYPRDLLEREITGTTILALRTDTCGRVTDATVQTPSGHKLLDQAAVDAARHWTLTAKERASGVGGVVPWPVEFKMDNSMVPRPPEWPSTHRHVRWVFDESAKEYPGAAEAEAAVSALPDKSYRDDPYRIPGGGFVQVDSPAGREFWYFIDTFDSEAKPLVAVHYKPVFDNDEPIVRLSIYCDDTTDHCAAFRRIFQRGLNFARPR